MTESEMDALTESQIEGTDDIDLMLQRPRRVFVGRLVDKVKERDATIVERDASIGARDADIARLQQQLNEAMDTQVAKRWPESPELIERMRAEKQQPRPSNPDLVGNEY